MASGQEEKYLTKSIQRAQKPVVPDHKQRCPHHPIKDAEMACETCSGQLVCNKCVISPEHRGHTFCDVHEMLDKKMSNLAQKVSAIDTKLLENKRNIKAYEREESRNEQLTDADVNKINDTRKYLKDKIDEAATRFIKQRKELTQKRSEIIQKNSKTCQRYSSELQLCSQHCTQALKSGKYEDIQNAEMEANDLLYNTTLPSTQVPEDLFSSKIVTDQQVDGMFGLLSKNELTKPPIHKSLSGSSTGTKGETTTDVIKVLSSFQLAKGMNIKSLCSPDHDVAWVVLLKGKKVQKYVQLVTGTGEITQTVTFPNFVTDICMDKDGAVFVCCFEGAVYQMIGEQGKRVHRFTTEYTPGSICITSTGDFIIPHYHQSKVVVYDGQGRVIKSLGEQGPYSSILVHPYRVKYNYNTGDVAIIDENLRTVVVLDSDLRFRFLYNGKITYTDEEILPSLTKNEHFDPWDVAFDTDNNIIVSDGIEKSVRMLNGKAQYIRTLFSDSVQPCAAAVDNRGSLWVGYDDGKIEIIRF